MTRNLFFLCFLLFGALVSAGQKEPESKVRFEQEMRRLLTLESQKVFEIKRRGGSIVVEFCPDNSCDAFRYSDDGPSESVFDFIYLFESAVPGYYVLKKWQEEERTHAYRDVLIDKYIDPSKCRREPAGEAARCVLRYLMSHQKISLLMVRYDLGERSETPVTLDEFLPAIGK